jgi:hypothetical protein
MLAHVADSRKTDACKLRVVWHAGDTILPAFAFALPHSVFHNVCPYWVWSPQPASASLLSASSS